MAHEVYLSCHGKVYHLPGVKRVVKDEAHEIGRMAEGLLEEARATTTWQKLEPPMVKVKQPSGTTNITVEPSDDGLYREDWFVCLNSPFNPVALEYGHQPSGYFKDKPSDAPEGLYILHRAARLI
jgi:hypothetical protein